MRKVALIIFGLAGAIILLSAFAGEDKQPATQTLQNQEALDAVKAEPKITDAIITDAGVLYAKAQSDGTDRSGYAEYLCGVVGDFPTSIERVVIVEAGTEGSSEGNAYGKSMGESWCK